MNEEANSIVRLKNYIKEDRVYQEWKSGNLKLPNDFELYCIENCIAIEEILDENSILKKKIKKLEGKLKEYGNV